MKKLFFLLSLFLYLQVHASPALTVDFNASVNAGTYNPNFIGNGNNIGATHTGREFLINSNVSRVRQNGVIKAIRFQMTDHANIDHMQFTLWREINGVFTRVGISEDFKSQLVSGLNLINLQTKIDAKQGDYYGFRYRDKISAPYRYTMHARTQIAGVTLYKSGYYLNDQTQWGNSSSLAGVIDIEILMQPPQVVFIGDSITTGAPKVKSPLTPSVLFQDFFDTYPHRFSGITNLTFQNMGIGSQASTHILSRFDNDVVALKPRLCILMIGVNDIALNINQATYINNIQQIITKAQSANIKLLLIEILPWTAGNPANHAVRESFNSGLRQLAAQNPAFVKIINAASAIGVDRTGYAAGNLWDIKPEYNADAVHLNDAGHQKLAEIVGYFVRQNY